MQIALLIAAIVGVMILFSLEKFSVELPALGLMIFLVLTGMLTPEQAFAGFGSEVVIMMLGLLILTAALERTGVADMAARLVLSRAGGSPRVVLIWIMAAAILIGAFVSNTAATAFFIPIVFAVAKRTEISPGKLLMPLAFASILASSITLIGTSTNIVVSGILSDYGYSPIGLFELTPVGLLIAVLGFLYMLFIGRRLIPDRMTGTSLEQAATRIYLTEILIPDGSNLLGKTLAETDLGHEFDLTVVRVMRKDQRHLVPRAKTRLQAGDVLVVKGRREDIFRAEERMDIELQPEMAYSLPDLVEDEVVVTEVILLPGSPMIGRTLSGLDIRNRFGFQVLAIHRHSGAMTRKLSQLRLRSSDILVVQGPREDLRILERQGLFRILEPDSKLKPRRRRARLAGGIFVGTLLLGASGLVNLPVAVLLGAVLVMMTRCVTPEEAYSQINWTVLILIAAMLALGKAMEVTGTAEFIAHRMLELFSVPSPRVMLTIFFLITVLLTQPMSNQAAAVIALPIAINAAAQVGWDPRPFAMMIAVAASCSFLTPLEPACLMVYGPGRYRFTDFPRVGFLLSLLVYAIAIILVPILWPV